jgi:hypothetical protein
MSVKKIVRQNRRRVGRPTSVGGDRTVTIRLPAEQLDSIDAFAVASNVQRSEAIRQLIDCALKMERKLEKLLAVEPSPPAKPRKPAKKKDEQ